MSRRGDRGGGFAGGLRPERRGGRSEPAPHQAVAQPQPPAGQAALDRPDRAAEPARRILVRQTLQVAKHDRRALALREAADLFIQDRKLLGAVWIRGRAGDRLDSAGLARPSAQAGGPRPCGDAAADAKEPRPQRVVDPDRPCPAHQNQERRLKRVGRGVSVGQQPETHSPDHRPVPLEEDGERILRRGVVPVQEPIQQLPVGQPAERPAAEQRPDVSAHAGRISAAHESVPLYRPTNVNMHRPGKSFHHSPRKKRKLLAHFHPPRDRHGPPRPARPGYPPAPLAIDLGPDGAKTLPMRPHALARNPELSIRKNGDAQICSQGGSSRRCLRALNRSLTPAVVVLVPLQPTVLSRLSVFR